MLVGAKVCDLTDDLLWFVCGLYVRILMSSLKMTCIRLRSQVTCIGPGRHATGYVHSPE